MKGIKFVGMQALLLNDKCLCPAKQANQYIPVQRKQGVWDRAIFTTMVGAEREKF